MDQKSFIKIKAFGKRLKKDFSVDRIIFFGSRAKGDYFKHSDIDLIIVSKDFKGMDFSKRITKMYDYWEFKDLTSVDFFCYTPEEFSKLSCLISIASEAMRKGVVIV